MRLPVSKHTYYQIFKACLYCEFMFGTVSVLDHLLFIISALFDQSSIRIRVSYYWKMLSKISVFYAKESKSANLCLPMFNMFFKYILFTYLSACY